MNLNFELLAPECSMSVNFEAKWCAACPALCVASMCYPARHASECSGCPLPLSRLIVQSLPLVLVGGIGLVMAATCVLRLVQTRVLHMLPFGSLSQFSLGDVCVGILISGLFMMYFGESQWLRTGIGGVPTCFACKPCQRSRYH